MLEAPIKSIAYEPYTNSIFYSIPKEKMIFRKYLQANISNQDDLILPVAPFYNGKAMDLEVDSFNSRLCWLQSIDLRSIVCSDLNGENAAVVFTPEKHSEKIAGFAIDSLTNSLFVMSTVRYIFLLLSQFFIVLFTP